MDEFGENIVEHNEEILVGFRSDSAANDNNFSDDLQKTSDDVPTSVKVPEFKMSFDDVVDENKDELNPNNVKLIGNDKSNSKKAASTNNENTSEIEKTADFYDTLDENMKESGMAVFDEEVLEEELSEASEKPSHT